MLSGRGLCDELITRPEESYRLWCVVCDVETSKLRRPCPIGGCRASNKQTNILVGECNMCWTPFNQLIKLGNDVTECTGVNGCSA